MLIKIFCVEATPSHGIHNRETTNPNNVNKPENQEYRGVTEISKVFSVSFIVLGKTLHTYSVHCARYI